MRISNPFDVLNRILDLLLIILVLLGMLMGLYSIYDSYLIVREANDSSLLKFKPGYEGPAPERSIEGNMVAWLTVDGTSIDYPVMQGQTNEEYLDKDPYGEYSLAGSIFLDSRNAADFSDGYSLIYGHHMSGDNMFGPITRFMDQDFFGRHQTGELTLGDSSYSLLFFAAMKVSATEDMVFNPTEHEKTAVLDYIRQHSEVLDENELDRGFGLRLAALSTCRYPDTTDRTVVFGYLSDTGKAVDIDSPENEMG